MTEKSIYIEPQSLETINTNDYVPFYKKQGISHVLAFTTRENTLPAFINYFDFSSSSVTTISQSATWYKLNTSTTQGFKRNGLLHENNKITNTSEDLIIFMQAIVSLSSGNNNDVHLAFFKNGVIVPCSEQEVTTSSGGKAQVIPIQCTTELKTGDYIEVYVKNQTAATNVAIDNFNCLINQL